MQVQKLLHFKNTSSSSILSSHGLAMAQNTRSKGAELAVVLSTRSKSGISGSYSPLTYTAATLMVTTFTWST